MEFIRSRSERVQQIIQGTFEADFTKYTQRVTEMAQHKNIRLNITTEFGKEIIVTMLPGENKELEFIQIDNNRYSSKTKNIDIYFNTNEDKHLEELELLKNLLPGIIIGLNK